MSDRFAALIAVWTLLLSIPAAAAPGAEGAVLGAESMFFAAGMGSSLPRFSPGVPNELPFLPGHAVGFIDGGPAIDFKGYSNTLVQATAPRNPKAPVHSEFDMALMLNRHLKTSLKFSLGGKDVWISGAFDREQSAFVSILVDGAEPLFFNVRGLLDKEETLPIGNATYKLSLSPNVIEQMESEIVLKNVANRKDRESVTIKEMLGAVSAAGTEIKLPGQVYRAFYYDDIKNGRQDKSSKSFAFLFTDAKGEIHVFLVPADLVPVEQIAVFKMYDNRAIGLQQVGGKLRVFDNP